MQTEFEVADWYQEQGPIFNSLAEIAATTLSALLRSNKVDFLVVSHRTKTLESIREKVVRKEYGQISDMTDIAGIRIITYIESDLSRAAELVREAFHVHTDKSVDKSEELSDDKFGYRSVHFVCELGNARIALPELTQFKGKTFEVQVRTVLQHAWAEIEHDRSYKFSGELPSAIRRRLNLLAGVLELADREFGLLAHEVDEYSERVQQSAKSGSLEKEELTSLSLSEYLKSSKELSFIKPQSATKSINLEGVIGELKRFGVDTIDDVESLLTADFLTALKQYAPSTTIVGLFRRAMLFTDMERYFSQGWMKGWQGMSSETFRLLSERYGETTVNETMKRYAVRRKGEKLEQT